MNETKKKTDFLLTFFIDDKVITKTLSDLLNNKNDRLYLEGIGLPRDFIIPFFLDEIENEKQTILKYKSNANDGYTVFCNNKLFDSCEIKSGDFLFFKNNERKIGFQILFISISEIKIDYKKYKLTRNETITIGRHDKTEEITMNDISFNLTKLISRNDHLKIHVDNDGNARLIYSYKIEKLKKGENVISFYVNGKQYDSDKVDYKLEMCDEIFIAGFSLIYMRDFIAVRDYLMESKLNEFNNFKTKEICKVDEQKYFVSSPRIIKTVDVGGIEIEAPPHPFVVDKTPALLVLGPRITMSFMMFASALISIKNALTNNDTASLVVGIIMTISMGLGAFFWPALLKKYQNKCILEAEENRQKRYLLYIDEIKKEIKDKRNKKENILKNIIYPSNDVLCSFLDENNKFRLWERSYYDDDFLDLRLGVGDKPFEMNIKIPKKGFQLYDDKLAEEPKKVLDECKVLRDVPISFNFKENRMVGIIGLGIYIKKIINNIILNIVSLHSYDEVKLVFIFSPRRKKFFDKFKNLPHVWSDDRKIRFFASNRDEVHNIFKYLDEVIESRKEEDRNEPLIPHYVIIVSDPELIEKENFTHYLEENNEKYGLSCLLAYGDVLKLPKKCTAIIQCDDNKTGFYIKNKNDNKLKTFALDELKELNFSKFINELTILPIKQNARTMGVVDRISFLQMYKAGNVDDLEIEMHWENNNSSKSLAAPIGVIAGGDIFSLDLHESHHGCHGLVAGTTGSGKSEFLQAFILSLAINYSPNEVSFVLVDFKGGDMARPFMSKKNSLALPHLSATISNLSGNVLYRALISFKAEIERRQRLFNKAAEKLNVDKLDINSYHKYFKNGSLNEPLPHLIIIIDEFAQLKTKAPEFLDNLIDVAQVGRSLGIHLILATQKPSGIVDPQIMSNSRFKVCLKVADKQDSMDMINKPDSALIKNPGRLYLQVGYDEIYECMQSGYSGAPYVPIEKFAPEEENTIDMIDNTSKSIHSAKIDLSKEKTNKTQLEAIVSEIVSLGQKKNMKTKPLWLDVLPSRILLDDLKKDQRGICKATIGILDFIKTQDQRPLDIDFTKQGNICVYGSDISDKLTFIQTLVYSLVCDYKYTEDELQIYAMDFNGRNLSLLNELPHTKKVIYNEGEIEEEYENIVSILSKTIDERSKKFERRKCSNFVEYRKVETIPSILVIIDNYEILRYSDSIPNIIGSCNTYGIYFVITGNEYNSIDSKVKQNISSNFVLKMKNSDQYENIIGRTPIVPEEDSEGRGITRVGKEIVEFQLAIPFDCETEIECRRKIEEKFKILNETCNTNKSQTDDDTIDDDKMHDVQSENIEEVVDDSIIYKQSQDIKDDENHLIIDGRLHGVNLQEEQKVCICYDAENDIHNYLLKLSGNICKFSNRKLIIIDFQNDRYKDIESQNKNCIYVRNTEELDSFIKKSKDILNDRIDKIENKDELDEGDENIFILIPNLITFFEKINDDQAGFFRKVLQFINKPEYRIFFITGYCTYKELLNDRIHYALINSARNYIFLNKSSYQQARNQIYDLQKNKEYFENMMFYNSSKESFEIGW